MREDLFDIIKITLPAGIVGVLAADPALPNAFWAHRRWALETGYGASSGS